MGVKPMDKFKRVLIRPDNVIKQALKQMDAMGEKTLIVADEEYRLTGSLTDGDIRRWILKGKRLDERISKVMNRHPMALSQDFSKEEAKGMMLDNNIECLPILDATRKVIDCLWWVDLFDDKRLREMLKVPVVIMAGGEGVRLHPFTKILPKPLMPVGDKPIIEMIINRFFEYGCGVFYLSLNYKSSIIKAYFADFEHKYKINYLLENKPLGTAGSLSMLKRKIKSTFFMSNCDIIIDADYADILRFHREKCNKITLISSMKNFSIPYGVCDIREGGSLKSIREKPEYDFLVNTGMYVLEPSIFTDIPKNTHYNITELINEYIDRGEKVSVYPVSEKSWIDVGRIEELHDILRNLENR
jgi:dTDP-glucose pyrophosphorylase/predicted transcriptional regulator